MAKVSAALAGTTDSSSMRVCVCFLFFFFQAEDGIRDLTVTGVQTCALPIYRDAAERLRRHVRHVVHLRVRVGLHAELVGPEAVDHVQRRHVECHRGVHRDRKSTRLNSSHSQISYAVFCLKKKKTQTNSVQYC